MKTTAPEFYRLVISYLKATGKPQKMLDSMTANILELSKTTPGISWQGTVESLQRAYKYCNHFDKVSDYAKGNKVQEEGLKVLFAAFRDLSSLRDPKGMRVMNELRIKFGEDASLCLMLWARKVTKRPDGSAVVILHVDNFDKFENMVDNLDGVGELRTGLITVCYDEPSEAAPVVKI